ncbi:sigma-54-dependent Fis family transcriptional regulator [candidate division KSB1 bacterium]|nr:sigma-54-dependent Fis family transcriptional regulator [candidate division KSB1 bacterium]
MADTDATVLIQGESGTGKELIAHALHINSRRRSKSFIPVNCGAVPANLLESDLFGHVRGAFTGAIANKKGWFESAEGGTIFLDEISEMSPELQVRLLRVLNTGEYSRVGSNTISYCDVRVVAATNKNLQALVKEGKFREDLFYRLNVIKLNVPPLRSRKGDIPLLVRHFLTVFSKKYSKNDLQISERAEACLLAHDFPGNVRELENIIQHAVIMTEGRSIEPHHLPAEIQQDAIVSNSDENPSSFKIAKQRVIETFEREFILDCLKTAKGNISQAAKAAGIHFANFHSKMTRYGIDPHNFK